MCGQDGQMLGVRRSLSISYKEHMSVDYQCYLHHSPSPPATITVSTLQGKPRVVDTTGKNYLACPFDDVGECG